MEECENERLYTSLVARAKAKIPEKKASHDRLQIPEPDIILEGKTTVFRNFGDIAAVLRREPDHILAFILTELGTAGRLDGKRVIFKGKVGTKQIVDKISDYVNAYVMCSECKRPDTQLLKEDRVLTLVCESCAARRPVLARKSSKTQEKTDRIIQGEIYELHIEDVGRKGDGVARKDQYIIYVAGATKGQTIRVKIDKVMGTIAFGKPVL